MKTPSAVVLGLTTHVIHVVCTVQKLQFMFCLAVSCHLRGNTFSIAYLFSIKIFFFVLFYKLHFNLKLYLDNI
jgi:hypothetical protein